MVKRYLTLYAVIGAIVLAICQPLSADSDEEASFMLLKKTFEGGNYVASEGGIEKYLDEFPSTRHSDELHLLLGKSMYYLGKKARALYEFEYVSDLAGSPFQDEAVLWQGEVQYDARDYRQAIASYQRVIDEFPSSRLVPFAYYSLGWSYYSLDDEERAQASFAEVVNSFPLDPHAAGANFRQAECLYRLGRYDESLKALDSFTARYSVSDKAPEALLLLGDVAYKSGDVARSADAASRAFELTRGDRWTETALFFMARARYAMAEYELSAPLFKRLASFAPTLQFRMSGLLGEAESLAGLGLYDEARVLYDALLIDPDASSVIDRIRYGIVELAFMEGDFERSCALAVEGIGQSSDARLLPNLYFSLARGAFAAGRIEEGKASLARAIALADSDEAKAEFHLALGDLHARMGDGRAAIESYDAILSTYRTSRLADLAQYKIGICLLSLKRYDEAALAFRSILENFPGSMMGESASCMLAFTSFKRGDFASAVLQFEHFLAKYQSSDFIPFSLFYRADALYNAGRYEEALAAYDLLSQEGENEELACAAIYQSGWCRFLQHDDQDAALRFAKVVRSFPNSALAPDAAYWFGQHLVDRGDLAGAEKIFSEFLSNYAESSLAARAAFQLALILEERKDRPRARNALKEIARKYPASEMAPASLSKIAEMDDAEEEKGEAIQALRDLVTGYPKSEEGRAAWRRLASMLRASGRASEAVDALKEALKNARGEAGAEIRYEIAECLEEAGDLEGAAAEYQKVRAQHPRALVWAVKGELAAARIFELRGETEKALELYDRIALLGFDESRDAELRRKALRDRIAPGSIGAQSIK